MKKIILPAILIAIASGCSTTTHWRHSSGNNSFFAQDDYQCEVETQSRVAKLTLMAVALE